MDISYDLENSLNRYITKYIQKYYVNNEQGHWLKLKLNLKKLLE